MIEAGRLNRRLILERPNNSAGAAGAVVEGWTTVDTVWGELRATGGREAYTSGKMSDEVTHRARIRFRTDVKNDWRVRLQDTATSPPVERKFRVVAVMNPDDGREQLHLMLKEFPVGGGA